MIIYVMMPIDIEGPDLLFLILSQVLIHRSLALCVKCINSDLYFVEFLSQTKHKFFKLYVFIIAPLQFLRNSVQYAAGLYEVLTQDLNVCERHETNSLNLKISQIQAGYITGFFRIYVLR